MNLEVLATEQNRALIRNIPHPLQKESKHIPREIFKLPLTFKFPILSQPEQDYLFQLSFLFSNKV